MKNNTMNKMENFIKSQIKKGKTWNTIKWAAKQKFGHYPDKKLRQKYKHKARQEKRLYKNNAALLENEKYFNELIQLNTPREVQLFALVNNEDPIALIDLWHVYKEKQKLFNYEPVFKV